MPGRDLSEDRRRMQELANVDWTDSAQELVRDKRGYPRSSYCIETNDGDAYYDRKGFRWVTPGVQHYMSDAAKQRKRAGTVRVGGSKYANRGVCSGCHNNIVLIHNHVDSNWPLYVKKLILTEWP